jgi:hypothetical protein
VKADRENGNSEANHEPPGGGREFQSLH